MKDGMGLCKRCLGNSSGGGKKFPSKVTDCHMVNLKDTGSYCVGSRAARDGNTSVGQLKMRLSYDPRFDIKSSGEPLAHSPPTVSEKLFM